jgi:hypothetical protein
MTTVPMRKGCDLVTDDERALARREFQSIYHQTWADVFRYAFVLMRHREDAEDVAAPSRRRRTGPWQPRPTGLWPV